MPGGNIAMAYFTPHLLPELEFDTDTFGISQFNPQQDRQADYAEQHNGPDKQHK
jgi:hypothetical protein